MMITIMMMYSSTIIVIMVVLSLAMIYLYEPYCLTRVTTTITIITTSIMNQ